MTVVSSDHHLASFVLNKFMERNDFEMNMAVRPYHFFQITNSSQSTMPCLQMHSFIKRVFLLSSSRQKKHTFSRHNIKPINSCNNMDLKIGSSEQINTSSCFLMIGLLDYLVRDFFSLISQSGFGIFLSRNVQA